VHVGIGGLLAFLVELWALMIVASTMVPRLIAGPAPPDRRQPPRTTGPQVVGFEPMPELADRGLVGTAAAPRSRPAKRANGDRVVERLLDPGSDRLNHCCRK